MSVCVSWICSSDEFKCCWSWKTRSHAENFIWNLAYWKLGEIRRVSLSFNCRGYAKELREKCLCVPCSNPVRFVSHELYGLEVQLSPESVLSNVLYGVPYSQCFQSIIVAYYGIVWNPNIVGIPCDVAELSEQMGCVRNAQVRKSVAVLETVVCCNGDIGEFQTIG